MKDLVSTQWLADNLRDVVLLDASYTNTIPGSPPSDPKGDFERGHIPGARFLDLDTLVDADHPLPSMLPPAALFTRRMRDLGIERTARVVLYDAGGHQTACRAWWVLRMFGVEAAILDGGIRKWVTEGRPVEEGQPASIASEFEAAGPIGAVRTLADMRETTEQIADARSAARFTGAEPDPRKECAAGHIPGSSNIPYTRFFAEDGTWKSKDAIAGVFEEAGIDPLQPLVATCGSGITAAVIVFAAHLLGGQAALYDGSWTEWGAQADTPKAIGQA